MVPGLVLEVGYTMVDDLDLFFDDWHAAGKVIVFAHLAGQLVKAGLCDGGMLAIGDNDADKGYPARYDSRDDALHHFAP